MIVFYLKIFIVYVYLILIQEILENPLIRLFHDFNLWSFVFSSLLFGSFFNSNNFLLTFTQSLDLLMKRIHYVF